MQMDISFFLSFAFLFSSFLSYMCLCPQSCLTLGTPWTITCQAPLSIGFSRQEYCCGLPFHSPGDLCDPWIEPTSLVWLADSLPQSDQASPQHAVGTSFFLPGYERPSDRNINYLPPKSQMSTPQMITFRFLSLNHVNNFFLPLSNYFTFYI